jgi:hypothetical protein
VKRTSSTVDDPSVESTAANAEEGITRAPDRARAAVRDALMSSFRIAES